MKFGTQSREGLVFSAYGVYAVRPDDARSFDARSVVRQLHGGVDVVLVLLLSGACVTLDMRAIGGVSFAS